MEELIGLNIKAYVKKSTLEEMNRELKYHGNLSARLIQINSEIIIVWIEEKK